MLEEGELTIAMVEICEEKIITLVPATSVFNAQEAQETIREGRNKRITAAAAANKVSNRSHLVTQLKHSTGETIFLIDLAGSETTRDATGTMDRVGRFINQSLLQLGILVKNMSKGKGETRKSEGRSLIQCWHHI
jgi:hypothetical protein